MDSNRIFAKLDEINARLLRIERHAAAGHAVNVGNGRLLVRCETGAVRTVYFVEADDRLIVPNLFADGAYEPGVTRFVQSQVKVTDHCIDVGANFGYYTCIMAKIAWQGRILALEADPQTFQLLQDNIFINWCHPLAIAFNVAAADGVGQLHLYRRHTRSGNTSIVDIGESSAAALGEPPPTRFTVQSTHLDGVLDHMQGRVDLVKIDIEGAEPLAFRGVAETIRLNPGITFIIEWSPGQMQAAGFDVNAFADDLAGLGLSPAIIRDDGTTEDIGWDALHSSAYFSGVALSRRNVG
jgi:FkbM family methyltransferase